MTWCQSRAKTKNRQAFAWRFFWCATATAARLPPQSPVTLRYYRTGRLVPVTLLGTVKRCREIDNGHATSQFIFPCIGGQCPQSGSDVDWAQAAAGAGGRRGRSTQGATVRCAGQPKRIGQVRTGRSALGQPLHLAWALGPAQEGDRLRRCRCNARPRHRPVCRRQLGVNTVALWVIIC